MKRALILSLVVLSTLALGTDAATAAVRVVRHPRRAVVRATVVVHPGFPLRRTLPRVYVRAPRVAIRVTPRLFLPSVVFGAAVVATRPRAEEIVWHATEPLARDDGWTELSLNVDGRGRQLLLDIDKGAAQVSFAEVVFTNGEARVIDFQDRVHRQGLYSLLALEDGRQVDHVRLVARADGPSTEITLRLRA